MDRLSKGSMLRAWVVSKKSVRSPKSSRNARLPCGRPMIAQRVSQRPNSDLFDEMVRKLDAFVVQKNLKRSEVRMKILKVLSDESLHFSAQDLVERIQERFPDVGRSTVYRNLPVLVECGLIQEGPTDQEGQSLFELSHDGHHDHIVCTDCRRIFEFHDEALESRQNSVSMKHGFVAIAHRHVIYGACEYKRKKA
jgi:Fur family transcriptional regulator, ferric uptake regulator